MPGTTQEALDAAAVPQKYIRTFESDSKTLKEGKRPSLTPLAPKTKEAPPPRAAAPAPTPTPAPVLPEASAQPLPDEYIRTFTADAQVVGKGAHPDLAPFKQGGLPAQEFMPRPSGAESLQKPASVPAASPEPESSPLHTYAGDFSELVKNKGASRATILAAEEDAGDRPAPAAPQRASARSLGYVLGGIVLLLLGGGGAYYAYVTYGRAPVIALMPTISAPIFVDERQQVSGSSEALTQAIEQSAAHALPAGQVRLLYTAVSTSTGESVFSALQLPAPGALLRNINANGSMAGIVSAGGNQMPFFILSVASYPDTFAAMLSWEKASGALAIPNALAAFYPAYPAPMLATSTSATSTPAATSTPLAPALFSEGWRDEVVANHDARAYRDAYGHTLMVYGYWNSNTLIIARDEAAFTEILARLATSRGS